MIHPVVNNNKKKPNISYISYSAVHLCFFLLVFTLPLPTFYVAYLPVLNETANEEK